ncbi:putative amino acid transporter, transmembrane domain-containing protein [Helianthus annuus]|nr:putative amino acid transporter, transmembrane domain-containing protein [Helianthus annuus]
MAAGNYDDEEDHPPLLQTSNHNLTGTVWTALAHFIAGVIGSGVLSLAWSVAQLGWIAGPLCVVVIARSNGCTTRNHSFLQAVHNILGYKNGLVCGCLVFFSLFKTGVVYVITTAICMRAIKQSNCFHKEGHDAACEFEHKYYMLMFGIIQIIASQIPNIFHTKWLSIIAAIMSFTYSSIGIGLGLAQVIEQGVIKGSINGISTTNPTQKVWLVAQAIGDIAFSFSFSLILLEIQSTLKTPPSQKVTMKKTSTIAVFITASFYLCCGASGYAAFGDLTPGNLLTGFGFYEPYWLVDFGNACIVLHLVGGYQIYSQTLFALVERWYTDKYPESILTRDIPNIKVSFWPEFRLTRLRLCFRTTYVVLTVAVAVLFPYFNEVLAFSGSIIFWPLTIYFPVEMYFVHKKVVPWSGKWIVLRLYSSFCLFVTVFTLVGSLQGLIAKRFG